MDYKNLSNIIILYYIIYMDIVYILLLIIVLLILYCVCNIDCRHFDINDYTTDNLNFIFQHGYN